ncbi:MAG: hypothetical protein JO096_01500 [Alphaproteobacteria bacterium]|nr:hypothetical protein [Alphaproteobacteria bacterium]
MTQLNRETVTSVSYKALIATVNDDGSYLLSTPEPVAFSGLYAEIELAYLSPTLKNVMWTGDCVLNLPPDVAGAVPEFIPVPSEIVSAPRAHGCPVQIETRLTGKRSQKRGASGWGRHSCVLEARILRVYIDPDVVLADDGRCGAKKWEALIACLRNASCTDIE